MAYYVSSNEEWLLANILKDQEGTEALQEAARLEAESLLLRATGVR